MAFLGMCAFLAVFLLDARAVLQVLSALLAGEEGALARVAAWVCLLAIAVVVLMAVRQAVAGNRPSRRGAKKQPGLIPGNWTLIVLGATAMATTGIAAWTVFTWVANILADGLVLATLAVGVMSIGSMVWAIRQPTYSESGKKAGRKRAARPPGPRPRPKADDAQLLLPPPTDVRESTFLHPPAEAAVPAKTTQNSYSIQGGAAEAPRSQATGAKPAGVMTGSTPNSALRPPAVR